MLDYKITFAYVNTITEILDKLELEYTKAWNDFCVADHDYNEGTFDDLPFARNYSNDVLPFKLKAEAIRWCIDAINRPEEYLHKAHLPF